MCSLASVYMVSVHVQQLKIAYSRKITLYYVEIKFGFEITVLF